MNDPFRNLCAEVSEYNRKKRHSRRHSTKMPFKHIALWSPTPQQGKSKVAKHLTRNRGYEVLSFASPVLEMIETLLMHHGLSMEEIDYYCKQAKEQPIPGIGKSYRYLARTLGTEWGRVLVGMTIWLDAFEQKFDRHSSRNAICVDDLRHLNEAQLLKRKGFLLVRVFRKAQRSGLQDTHSSDVELAAFTNWDHEIMNTGTLDELYQSVDQLIA